MSKKKQIKIAKKISQNSKKNSSFKNELLNESTVKDYDKLFEQKLASEYKQFKDLKEHKMQSKKFLRILLILITIILVVMLLLTYSK